MDTATGKGTGGRRPWEQTRGEKLLDHIWVLLPFALLLISSVLMLVSSSDTIGGKLLNLAIAAGAAAAYWGILTSYDRDRERVAPMLVFYAVELALLWLLVSRHGWYALFYFAMLFQAFLLPGAWAVLGVTASVLVAYSTGAQIVGGSPDQSTPATAWTLGVNIAVTTLIGLLIRSISDHNDRRRALLEEVSKAHERLEASLAENAGLQRQLLNQAREAGMLDERARLAREIHDTIAQGLTGIITQLEAAEKALDGSPDAARHLDSARRLARESLSEARRSVQALRPEPLEAAQLPDALGEVAARWAETNDVKIDVTTTGTVAPMHPEVEVTLLRVAQEALANVAKHARASRVGVTLSYMDDQVTLDVRDDGAGFDPDAPPPAGPGGGYGLPGMRQRLARLAGTLEVESAPGQGTAISATVPAIPVGARSAPEARRTTSGGPT